MFTQSKVNAQNQQSMLGMSQKSERVTVSGITLPGDYETRPSNIILVTPQLAELWLSQNIKRNRVPSKGVVEKYARIMKRGEWRPNPSQPISFTKDGILVNGQHRLNAVKKANVSVYMAVVWDAEESDFTIIDVGKKRTLADLFKMSEISNAVSVASIVVRYVALKRGRALYMGYDGGSSMAGSLDLAQDYLEEYETTPDLYQQICLNAKTFYKNGVKMLHVSDIGGIAMFLIKEKGHSKEKVLSFFDALYNGGSTYRYLQDLTTILNNDINSDKKMRSSRKQSLIAKAWNMFLADSHAKRVNVHMGEIVKFD